MPVLAILAACFAFVAFATPAAASPPTMSRVMPANLTGAAGSYADFWTVDVTPGTSPASTGLQVWVDLRPIGGPARAAYVNAFLTCDDDTSGDLTFFACYQIPWNAPVGTHNVTFTVMDAQGRSSTLTLPLTVTAAADTDHDGLPDGWEQLFGLDPNSAAGNDGADGDPDGDGRTNLQEFEAGSHPRATFTRYFAEGAANEFFSTRLVIYVPPDTPATRVVVRFLGSTGGTTWITTSLSGSARRWVQDVSLARTPEQDFSIVVESDQPLVVERTMSWDGHSFAPRELYGVPTMGYGSHAETGIPAASTTWYLAEGATHGGFDLFYLLQNADDAAAHVTVNYLRPAPLAPIVKSYVVGAHTRLTIWVDQEDPALAATDVSASISADRPIVVERSMYYSTATQPFAAGHNGAAVATPATRWYLAEGAASSFFDMFLLIANPGDVDAAVEITYLRPSGDPVKRTHTVAAHSRFSLNVATENPPVEAVELASIVDSTNGVPIVVERAMWWPHGQWYEAHLSAGATETGTRWAVADCQVAKNGTEGSVLFANEVETYLLIANTSATAGTVTLTLDPSYNSDLIHPQPTVTLPLPAYGRLSVPLSGVLASTAAVMITSFPVFGDFSLLVESSGPQIVVERSVYSNYGGQLWAAGTSALGTKLQ